MNFIEIEKSIREKEWDMSELHSHSHYEIYFLLTGTRKFFLKNKMYNITAPCVIVITPYTMHKTEGYGFSRININVSQNYLNNYEQTVLESLKEKIIFLNSENVNRIFPVLEEMSSIYTTDLKFKNEKLYGLFEYVITQLEKIDYKQTFLSVSAKAEKVSPLVLNIIDYLSKNYTENISLDLLSKKFFLSRVSICSAFKKAMNCTIGEYILHLKLNKAKELLSNTKKSVEEISTACGFSSGAYFGLIFKEKNGMSPLQYRKLQKTKE